MKRILITLGCLWSLSAAVGPAYAQAVSDPLLSAKRLSIAAGVDREVIGESVIPEERWLGVLSLSYNLLSPGGSSGYTGPRIALISRWEQPFSAESRPHGVVGVRVTLWDGSR